ncbi:hypothetical protein ACE6H2_004959 [Prunus campanulata]
MVRSCIWSLIYLACELDLLLQGMGDLFWLAFSRMRASLLKLDLAFLQPLISFVGRSGFVVEDESGAVDFRLGQCVANRTALLIPLNRERFLFSMMVERLVYTMLLHK